MTTRSSKPVQGALLLALSALLFSLMGVLIREVSSTAGNEAVVFFGWAPHPMNVNVKMTYLTGSEDVFGPDEGAATVSTMTAAGYQAQCGNVARLLHNLRFSSAQVSQVMAPILDRTQPLDAARQWLKANPEPLKAWLDGVSTFDGKDGLAALQASLK